MNILCFTDSRGQHKDTFCNQKIFTERLRDELGARVILCPFKWTTTLDFLYSIVSKTLKIRDYDKVILYTGVVEFSPRPISNYEQCYATKKHFLTREDGIEYDVEYKGEKTKSLISINYYEKVVIPTLQTLGERLILINTNKIASGWDGNYLKVNPIGRPKNIGVVADYSAKTLGKFQNLINLLEWNDEDIKRYTVDNMHLTHDGSEYIYNKLLEIL